MTDSEIKRITKLECWLEGLQEEVKELKSRSWEESNIKRLWEAEEKHADALSSLVGLADQLTISLSLVIETFINKVYGVISAEEMKALIEADREINYYRGIADKLAIDKSMRYK